MGYFVCNSGQNCTFVSGGVHPQDCFFAIKAAPSVGFVNEAIQKTTTPNWFRFSRFVYAVFLYSYL
jgi:hypothetical protein